MSRKALLAFVVLQAAIGFLQHGPVFRELASFEPGARAVSTAVTWPAGSSLLLAAALALLAFLWTPGRPGVRGVARAGRTAGAGLVQIAALGLVHYAVGLATGRLTPWVTVGFLAVSALGATALRRARGQVPPAGPVGADALPGGGWSGWDAVSGVFLLTSLVAMTYPYAFEDARVIWGCRAFALDSSGSLASLGECSHRNYPPLFSILLWISARDPLFQGRVLAWLSLTFFAFFLRDRLRRTLPGAAAPALLFFVSTVHVWQGASIAYANVPLMVFLSTGMLLALGIPAEGGAGPSKESQAGGALCLAAAVLLRPDGVYYVVVIAVAVLAARLLWRERWPLLAFAAPAVASLSWALRPDALRPASAIPGAFAGSFLGAVTGEWRSVAPSAVEAAARTLEVFLHAWQGQWLSHKGLGLAIYLLAGVTAVAARRGLFKGRSAGLGPETRLTGLVTLGGLLAVVVCFAAVPFVSDPVGAVQPFDGDYLACYRNFVRVGLGRMTVHLYPVACLFAMGLLSAMDGGGVRAAFCVFSRKYAKRSPDPQALAVLLVALVTGVAFAPHAAGYFFLFDDFALVSVAMKSPLREFFVTAVGGFFRPVALCLVWLESLAFGWSLPWGYAMVSAALHGLNSLFVFLLLRRLGQRREPALLGAGVFLLSPWAGETFFWVSAQFDLYSVLFSFVALWLAFRGVDGTGRPGPLVAAVFVAAVGACLSKEMAVTLPGLFLFLCVWRRGVAGLGRWPLAFAGSMAAASAVSLLLRSRTIDPLGGAYGSLPALWSRSDLLANLWSQMRCFVLPPGGPAGAFDLAWGIPLVLLVAAAVVSSPRESLSGLAALGISLAPVLWSGMERGSTAGGRYLYLPGFLVAALVSLGFSAVRGADRASLFRRRAAPYPAALLLASGLGLLVGQQRLWSEAVRLSRTSVEQVRREMGTGALLHICNLPYALREGPYVLKSYAFRLYLGVDRPKVRSEAVTIPYNGDAAISPASFPDPFSEYPAPPDPAAEKEILLDLRAR